MADTLVILKRGLLALQKQTQVRRLELQKDLREKRKISKVDEGWLDGMGNLVDEEQLIEHLESASDYQKGIESLDVKDREIVEKLQRLGSGIKSKKRKCASLIIFNVHI
jgi:hypothetical protein